MIQTIVCFTEIKLEIRIARKSERKTLEMDNKIRKETLLQRI